MNAANEDYDEEDLSSNKKVVREEKWYIDSRNLFEEFDVSYEHKGLRQIATVQAQPTDRGSSKLIFLLVNTDGNQSLLEYDGELASWIDSEKGETIEAKLIGAEIEKHMQPDDSPQEDAGIDNADNFDPANPFTAWYKLFGKKHRIRIEPVFASPRNQYYIYNLDNEHESDVPERIIIYDSGLDAWVEKDNSAEYNSWLDREKGYSLYSWIIGNILDAIQ